MNRRWTWMRWVNLVLGFALLVLGAGIFFTAALQALRITDSFINVSHDKPIMRYEVEMLLSIKTGGIYMFFFSFSLTILSGIGGSSVIITTLFNWNVHFRNSLIAKIMESAMTDNQNQICGTSKSRADEPINRTTEEPGNR
jgi:hypothetical protein